MWRAISMVVLLAATEAPARAADGWAEVARTFDAAVAKENVVGASIAMVRGGRIVAHREHGLADREAGQRVDERTIYHWGSLTKTLTAIALLQLVERKKISLDDPILRWVPELRAVHDPFDKSLETITLRMLLSHTAGFQGPTWPYAAGKPWEPFEPTTWAQLVAMMPYQELQFRPGSTFGYSNPGFIYLARVIEAETGDPWEVYVQKNIFAPLGLDRSYFGTTPYHLAADRANSYELKRDEHGGVSLEAYGREFDPGITMPNGGWNAPVADLAKYLAFLAGEDGDPATRRRHEGVLSRKTLESMWQPVVAMPGDDMWMGQSFYVSKAGAPLIVGHTGHQAGFASFFYVNPKNRTAIVGVFNTSSEVQPSFYELTRAARQALLSR